MQLQRLISYVHNVFRVPSSTQNMAPTAGTAVAAPPEAHARGDVSASTRLLLAVEAEATLLARGLSSAQLVEWAQGVASSIKERYPVLAEALKAHKDVRGELEAIVLIRDTMTQQFPPK